MICSHCDREMPDVSAFCPECGHAVHSGDPAFEEGELRAPNLQARVLGAIAYLTLVPAVLFLVIPRFRQQSFVRFHAWQSVFFAGVAVVAMIGIRLLFALLSLLPGIGFLLACLLAGVGVIAFVIAWLVLVVKAVLGKSFKLPWIGSRAARLTR